MNARLLTSSAALALFLATPSFAAVTNGTDTPSISVKGESEIRIVPDEVFFAVAVTTIDKDVLAASTENDAKLKKLLATAKAFGIPAAQIQTSEMSILRRENMSQGFLGFEVRKSVTICLKDLPRFEELFAALVKAGANEMPGIEFRSTKLEEARARARLDAVKAAREKATAMAGVLGEKLGRPLSISESPVSVERFAYVDPSAGAMHEGFAPGEIGVRVSVDVRFALTS